MHTHDLDPLLSPGSAGPHATNRIVATLTAIAFAFCITVLALACTYLLMKSKADGNPCHDDGHDYTLLQTMSSMLFVAVGFGVGIFAWHLARRCGAHAPIAGVVCTLALVVPVGLTSLVFYGWSVCFR